MLDTYARQLVQPACEFLAREMGKRGAEPLHVTLWALAAGVLGAGGLALGWTAVFQIGRAHV